MGRHQSRIEAKLIDLLNSSENANKCGECGSTYPTWASYNLGIFLCGRCANIHKKLGSHISKVKSLSLDNWDDLEVNRISFLGNKRAKAIWNPKKEPFPIEDDDDIIENYLRAKYIEGRFRYDPIDEREYDANVVGRKRGNSRYAYHQDDNDDFDRFKDSASRFSRSRASSTVSSGRHRSRASSRHSNIPPPRLTHRTPTVSEKQKYYLTSYRLARDMGLDQDLLIEALVLTHGDSKIAVEAVLQDAETYQQEEAAAAPPLPRRRENLLSSDKTGVIASSTQSSSGFDWMSGSPTQQQQQLIPSSLSLPQQQPVLLQLQPFMDQATGMIVYVDPITGQQYLDTNNTTQQQQQQQLQYAQNTGLDKSTILSLYQRPDLFTSPVAVTEEQKQEILRQLQQQQLTQLQLEQQQQQQYLLQQQQQQQQWANQQMQLQMQLQTPQQGFWG